MQISIVSGTYNRLPQLQRMVESARVAAEGLEYEIILVDGGSRDGTIGWCNLQPDIKLIKHGKLLGSAKAYQDGFQAAQGEYVVTGNDDITFEPTAFKAGKRILDEQYDVGQVAFGHKYQNRPGDKNKPIVQGIPGGYIYAQCGMTRRYLLELVGWCGIESEGYKHYGWDNYISSRLWELGWKVANGSGDGCAVIDLEVDDNLRVINNDGPRQGNEGNHPDAVQYWKIWQHRLPQKANWVGAPDSLERRVLNKARRGTLRTLRFKAGMRPEDQMRVGMINAFKAYGTGHQVNQSLAYQQLGAQKYQNWVIEQIRDFKADLVIFQAQHDNNVMPETVRDVRKYFPNTYLINWDGDTHYPLRPFNYDIACAVHLQLCVSPTLFEDYKKHEVCDIGYWPIAVEDEYLQVKRSPLPSGPDVLFTAALYGIGQFPEAVTRRDAVIKLRETDLNFALYGYGWEAIKIKGIEYTGEQHGRNAQLMADAKMTLSISQTKDLWGYTSDRLYNILATGCPALVQQFAGMEEHGLIDGVSCIAWRSLDEMVEKARHYILHPEEREQIGAAGRQLIVDRHNWPQRVKQLWQILGGLDS